MDRFSICDLVIDKKVFPTIYKLLAKYPIETINVWRNININKPLGYRFDTELDSFFKPILIEKIVEAFEKDEIISKNPKNISGYNPINQKN